ncbi:PAAR domain-containing protein [Massilia sp. YMA4]|uniref:PAAR domain-containing protein n=1 Tax=Massilia sp. YMA4 TaxID=1593482 RepID=UPI000DD12E3E|nr:PAAR domain-containing protein [Massilia sp. YMA4]AXA90026.1 PAAR domain-containing protein [Massilia sp. YMA4]
MPNVIRLGDPTSHGGKVVSVSATHVTVDGIAVARVGDLCVCPVKGHEVCTIAEGSATHAINGVPVAYEGHKTSCGATLIATAGNFNES